VPHSPSGLAGPAYLYIVSKTANMKQEFLEIIFKKNKESVEICIHSLPYLSSMLNPHIDIPSFTC
jgi:hypothetical protein